MKNEMEIAKELIKTEIKKMNEWGLKDRAKGLESALTLLDLSGRSAIDICIHKIESKKEN